MVNMAGNWLNTILFIKKCFFSNFEIGSDKEVLDSNKKWYHNLYIHSFF